MDRAAWRDRQQAWSRFHAWEAAQPATTTAAERLARVGELLELYRKWHPEAARGEGIEAVGDRVRRMHAALRRLRLPA